MAGSHRNIDGSSFVFELHIKTLFILTPKNTEWHFVLSHVSYPFERMKSGLSALEFIL
jgi:hypothetical protein